MDVADNGIAVCEIKNNGIFPVGNRPVALWLFLCAAMVAIMVGLGGLTRLTGSGLSMVHWQPQSFLPPLDQAAWQAAFDDYRRTPQSLLVNVGMDLAGFQRIFWLEYLHRLWGRLVGVAVLVPLVVLWARGTLSRPVALRVLALFTLGGVQGVLGWLMVASGLVDHPEVSPYRLAAHLGAAFIILGGLLWMGFAAWSPRKAGAEKPVVAVLALVLVTVIWGGLVAGMKAGLIYNTFPLMEGSVLPADGMDILRSPGAVQFAHRLLALSSVVVLTLLALRRRALRPAAAAAWCQASLGIATLLLQVPLPLAVAHQMGAVVVFVLVVRAI
jgi:heme a synthase